MKLSRERQGGVRKLLAALGAIALALALLTASPLTAQAADEGTIAGRRERAPSTLAEVTVRAVLAVNGTAEPGYHWIEGEVHANGSFEVDGLDSSSSHLLAFGADSGQIANLWYTVDGPRQADAKASPMTPGQTLTLDVGLNSSTVSARVLDSDRQVAFRPNLTLCPMLYGNELNCCEQGSPSGTAWENGTTIVYGVPNGVDCYPAFGSWDNGAWGYHQAAADGRLSGNPYNLVAVRSGAALGSDRLASI